MKTLSLALCRSLVLFALTALLFCSGCATSGENRSGSSSETGPPRSAASGAPASEGAGQSNSCSAPASSPRGSCGGCSVTCGDKPAFCTPGEEWPSGGASCQKTAVCECH
jgi:hypothetical protein